MKELIIILTILILGSCGLRKKKNLPIELTPTNYYCDVYNHDELYFSKNEVLNFPQRVVYVVPDSNYVSSVNEYNMFKNLNKNTEEEWGLSFDKDLVETYVDSNVLNIPVNYKSYLNLLDHPEYITQVIFPTGTKFIREFEGDNRVSIIQGAALGIGANVYFIREEYAETNINWHEVGHLFELLHPFQLPDLSEKGLSCDTGDYVGDTPNGLKANLTEEEKKLYDTNVMGYSKAENLTDSTPIQRDRVRNHIHKNYHKRKLIKYEKVDIDYSKHLYDI